MLEFPEVQTLSAQLQKEIAGKTVAAVLPPNKPHKFCWYQGDPERYEAQIKGRGVVTAQGFGIFCAIDFEGGRQLCVNDGVNVRLTLSSALPKAYQLAVLFEDGAALAFTVAMYGGVILHAGDYDDAYYRKSLNAVSPLSPDFPAYYERALSACKQSLSLKAFLATEQRFAGIGNGVLQDILFRAGMNPKRKLATLTDAQKEKLMHSAVEVVGEMTAAGGRDTEKDLYGAYGGYRTRMSKNTYSSGCPACGGPITKEAYLGGSVYYCPKCQPLEK